MWIKSLDEDVWVNMKHVTHFTIKEVHELTNLKGSPDSYEYVHYAYAYLDATMSSFDTRTMGNTQQEQTHVPVCRGSKEECREFIDKQQFLEGLFQRLGYLFAGGVGAVITLLFS